MMKNTNRAAVKNRRESLLNNLTVLVLAATACLVCFYSAVAMNFFNLSLIHI